jgi:opacity protein-like surface antigen
MTRCLAITVVLLILAGSASGQMKFGGGAQVGVSFSSFPKPVSDYFGTGFGFGAHGDLDIMKYFAARLNVDYHMFPSNKDKIKNDVAQQANVAASDIGIDGLNGSVVGITANGLGKIPTKSPFTPYGLIGLGIHIISISDGKVTYQGQAVPNANIKGNTETKFGLNFGAGTEYALGQLKLYLELKYVLIFTSDNSTSHFPVMVGVTFGG